MSSAARFAVFLAVVLGVWLAEHLYVGWRLASLPAFEPGAGRRWLIAWMVVGFLSYPLGRIAWQLGWRSGGWVVEYLGAVWMGTLFLLVAACVLVDLVTLGGLVLRPWLAQIRSVAAVGAVVLAAAAWIGGLRSPQVVEIELGVAGLGPQDDGLRLVQVSDLHLGTLIGRRWLEGTIERVLMLDPDVIAITGDLIDGDAGAVEQLLPELSRLRAPRGVFAVLGNHEHYAGAERSRALMRSAGYRVLDNQAEELAPGLWVAGVPDPRGAAQTGAQPGADLEATLSAVPRGASVVLLLHSPEGVERAAAAGVDLMLCGHTHGGQIWPFHYLVQRAYPRFAGVQVVNGMTLVISRGAGLWGPPMRLFAPADVVLVTFRTRD